MKLWLSCARIRVIKIKSLTQNTCLSIQLYVRILTMKEKIIAQEIGTYLTWNDNMTAMVWLERFYLCRDFMQDVLDMVNRPFYLQGEGEIKLTCVTEANRNTFHLQNGSRLIVLPLSNINGARGYGINRAYIPYVDNEEDVYELLQCVAPAVWANGRVIRY